MRRKFLIGVIAIIIAILAGFIYLKYKSIKALEGFYEMDYRLMKEQNKQMKLIDKAEFLRADTSHSEFDTLEKSKTKEY